MHRKTLRQTVLTTRALRWSGPGLSFTASSISLGERKGWGGGGQLLKGDEGEGGEGVGEVISQRYASPAVTSPTWGSALRGGGEGKKGGGGTTTKSTRSPQVSREGRGALVRKQRV